MEFVNIKINRQKFLTSIALCCLVFSFTATRVFAVLTLNATTITSDGVLTLTPASNLIVNGFLGIGTTTPLSPIEITNNALASGAQAFRVNATLSTVAATQTGFRVAITSSGSASTRQIGSAFSLVPGYTGPQTTVGLQAINNTLSTANNPWQDSTLTGNLAIRALSEGTQTTGGANVGVYGAGDSSMFNVGVFGTSNGSSVAVPNAVNIGVVGHAFDRANPGDAGNPYHEGLIHISGLFTGGSGYINGRANESASILSDDSWPGNGADVPYPIFLGRINNGTNVFDLHHYGMTLGGKPGGAATNNTIYPKTVTGIADATATDVVTVTVPNAAHAAAIKVKILGSLGAGGAVGAFECSAVLEGTLAVTRTAGLDTVATASTPTQTSSSCVSGATTVTLAYSVSAISGATSGTQTFTIKTTITKGGGSSANHQVVVSAEVLNANTSGITIQ